MIFVHLNYLLNEEIPDFIVHSTIVGILLYDEQIFGKEEPSFGWSTEN